MTTAIVNATLIDGTGRDPVPSATIVIDEDRIARIGAAIEPPRGAEIIDAAGLTIMPGMIDCHVHLYGKTAPIFERARMPASLQLFHGAKNATRTARFGLHCRPRRRGHAAGFQDGNRRRPHSRTAHSHRGDTPLADRRARR